MYFLFCELLGGLRYNGNEVYREVLVSDSGRLHLRVAKSPTSLKHNCPLTIHFRHGVCP